MRLGARYSNGNTKRSESVETSRRCNQSKYPPIELQLLECEVVLVAPQKQAKQPQSMLDELKGSPALDADKTAIIPDSPMQTQLTDVSDPALSHSDRAGNLPGEDEASPDQAYAKVIDLTADERADHAPIVADLRNQMHQEGIQTLLALRTQD